MLIDSNQRINNHKTGFDILRSADATDFLSLKVFNTLQSVEKSMIRRQLSNYAVSSIRLNKHKSYFKVIVMLTGDISLNPGPVTAIDNNDMCETTSLFVTVISLLTGLNMKLVLTVIFQIVEARGACLKIGETILSI